MTTSPATLLTDTPCPAVALVLGGSGFIGRHVVQALLAQGCVVAIGSRRPDRIDAGLPEVARSCPRREARFENLLDADDWLPLLEGMATVVNCVGILRQRGRETYRRVHYLAPTALAEACRRKQVRLIHISALGLNAPVHSRFLRSKRDAEQALRDSGADWRIVRPSLLDGEGGFGAKWIRRVARWPIHALPADAIGRIAALDVRDLGEAVARLVIAPPSDVGKNGTREFDLGGPDPHTLSQHLAAIRRLHTANPAHRLRIPALLARLGSHLCDLLQWTPYSYGHWELLRRDNLPGTNRLPELLGRTPRAVGLPRPAEIAVGSFGCRSTHA